MNKINEFRRVVPQTTIPRIFKHRGSSILIQQREFKITERIPRVRDLTSHVGISMREVVEKINKNKDLDTRQNLSQAKNTKDLARA